MKIASSEIEMASSREYMEKTTRTHEIGASWDLELVGAMQRRSMGMRQQGKLFIQQAIIDLKNNMMNSLMASGAQVNAFQPINLDSSFWSVNTSQIDLMQSIRAMLVNQGAISADVSEFKDFTPIARIPGIGGTGGTGRLGFGIMGQVNWKLYEQTTYSHAEQENTRFASSGLIKTADGRSIDFALDLAMDRSYIREDKVSFSKEGTAYLIDPLVLNFDGQAAELSSTTFSFDLDADGRAEDVSCLKSGSGFLALDLNQDGIINDGKELFGPRTQSGFGELAAYDEDGNQWIDENDSVFDSLKVWKKTDDGQDTLESLKDSGVGAISLNRADTAFSLKDDMQLLGEVQSTGIYLTEQGQVKTLQELDFAT